MFKLKELPHILIAIILFAFVISFLQGLNPFLWSLLVGAIVILINQIGKKITAYYYQSETESKIWQFERWGYYKRSHFKKPLPMGIILPFTLSWLSWGWAKCLTLLQTEIKPTIHRASKKHGLDKYTEMVSWHIAVTMAWGFGANLIFALAVFIFARHLPLLLTAAKFSSYYVLWNIIPFSKLDGLEMFFSSRPLWYIIAVLSLIFLAISLFVV